MSRYLLIICICAVALCSAQQNRIPIRGIIHVSENDKEGVTIYNSSSNSGTITNSKGEFDINVALNDVIEVSALQFQDFSVTITQKVLDTKFLKVVLVEQVNRLNEVVVLSYGLSGHLKGDITDVTTYNKNMDDIYFGLENQSDFVFKKDYLSRVENPAFDSYHPRMENMLNLVAVGGLLIQQILAHIPKNKNIKPQENSFLNLTPINSLVSNLDAQFLSQSYKVPKNRVEAFKAFLVDQPFDTKILYPENTMYLYEHITAMRNRFLNN